MYKYNDQCRMNQSLYQRPMRPSTPFPAVPQSLPIATRAPPSRNLASAAPHPPQRLIIKESVSNTGHSVSNSPFPTRRSCWPKTCTVQANPLLNSPNHQHEKGPAKRLQMSDGRLRASTQHPPSAGLRAVTTHPFRFSFSSARVFPFTQPCKVRSGKGVEKGLWANERPHATVPPQRRRGIRHSLSLVLAPASTVPSGSKSDHMPPVPGGPRAGCGYWMRGLFRHSVAAARRKRAAKAAPNKLRSLLRRWPWSWSTSPPWLHCGMLTTYIPSTSSSSILRTDSPEDRATVLHGRRFSPTRDIFVAGTSHHDELGTERDDGTAIDSSVGRHASYLA